MLVLAAIITSLPCALPSASADARRSATAAAPATLQLGTQTLELCATNPLAYCGKLSVPLDYSSPESPSISIAYRWYPATVASAQAKGTVVPVEGGPGYPSIESVLYASGTGEAGYAPMYGRLLEHWNMLAVDNRGTGKSAPLRCGALQRFPGTTGTALFQRTVGECGEALDHRWKYRDGGFVHASDLFTSAPAAADMAAVIKALELPKVDLYGDSYGSFFAQAFASRFPRLVRSVILDSTYETSGLDPFYRSSVDSMPTDFQYACDRSSACASAEGEAPWSRIETLAASLRRAPASGVVPGPSGKLEKVAMGVVGLADLVNDAAEDRQVYRDLDAAARALLQEHDAAPLLRLYAQRLAVDEAYFGLPVSEYSVELYFAVGCLDYPQLFDMSASPQLRSAQLRGAELGLPPSTYSPFTTEEWLAQDENTEAYTGCLDWPSPTIAQPPTSGASPLLAGTVPVLVLGGELDAWTPPVDVPKVLAEVGGHARFIELANSTHVVGEGETVCGSALIQAFVAHPQDLDTMDAACAAAVPAIHSVGVYPSVLSAEPPIAPAPGSNASPTDLRLAAAAVQTAGDAVARYDATEASKDHGLNGGSVTASKGGAVLTLQHDQLIPGVAVSGTVTLSPAPIADDGEVVVATLTVTGTGVRAVSFTATWTTSGGYGLAEVSGSAEGTSVGGTTPAP